MTSCHELQGYTWNVLPRVLNDRAVSARCWVLDEKKAGRSMEEELGARWDEGWALDWALDGGRSTGRSMGLEAERSMGAR